MSSSDDSSSAGAIAKGVIALIGLIIGLIVTINTPPDPHSTEGVVTIDDYTAAVHRGDTLVLTSKKSKYTHYVWQITWDGEHTMHIEVTNDSSKNASVELCGPGCTVTHEVGWLTNLEFTQIDNDAIQVHWPWPWKYLRYEK